MRRRFRLVTTFLLILGVGVAAGIAPMHFYPGTPPAVVTAAPPAAVRPAFTLIHEWTPPGYQNLDVLNVCADNGDRLYVTAGGFGPPGIAVIPQGCARGSASRSRRSGQR